MVGSSVMRSREKLEPLYLGPMQLSDSNSCRILTYGEDEVLLKTRKSLLKTVGINSDIARTLDEFIGCISASERGYDIFIVCHTVPQPRREAIVDAAKNADVEVYALSGIVQPADFLAHVQELISAC
jgi:hypothetical protein